MSDHRAIVRLNLTRLCDLTTCSLRLLDKCIETGLLCTDEKCEIESYPTGYRRNRTLYDCLSKKSLTEFLKFFEIIQEEELRQSDDVIDILRRAMTNGLQNSAKTKEGTQNSTLTTSSAVDHSPGNFRGDGDGHADNCWFEVPENIRQFVGRESELQTIHQHLSLNKKDETVITVISGMGGIGKSTLAVRYAWEYRNFYDSNVIWINAEFQSSIIDAFSRLSQMISTSTAEKSASDICKSFRNQKLLIILDNVENYAGIESFIPKTMPNLLNPYFLVTTRSRIWSDKFKIIELDAFSEIESISCLQSYLELEPCDVELVKQLCAKLQMLPLAVRQAAAKIKMNTETCRTTNQIEIQNYLSALKTEDFASGKALLDFEYWNKTGDAHAKTTTYRTWNSTLSKIEQLNGLAIEIINISAYLKPENIPIRLFYGLLRKKSGRWDFRNCAHPTTAIHEAVALLDDHCVIKRSSTEEFTAHRLVQKVIRLQLDEQLGSSSYFWVRKVMKLYDAFLIREFAARGTSSQDIIVENAKVLIDILKNKAGEGAHTKIKRQLEAFIEFIAVGRAQAASTTETTPDNGQDPDGKWKGRQAAQQNVNMAVMAVNAATTCSQVCIF